MRRLRWTLAAFLALSLLQTPLHAAPRFRPVQDDVFYMFMPIAWRDSDSDPWRFGDFGGMTASLPYLQSLGVTAIWMTPIFTSPAYHGYQHGRADSINTRFGDESQFLAFVRAAHADSIKVFVDFVAYGISQSTPWFQDSYGNPGSVYDSWLAYTNPENTSYLGCCPYPTWDGETVGFIHWDLRNPEVTQLVTGWAEHWLDPDGDGDPADGIDGYRLDHVSYDDPNESAFGYDISWWVQWNAALRSVYPGVFTFAEQADWGYGYQFLPTFDAVFTKPFEGAARDGLSRGDGRPLATVMETTCELRALGGTFLATIGDHDVDRLATALGDDPGRLRAAAAVLMLQPFPPVIYFGDEIGMRGAKRTDFSGDAADIPFREPFKWNAVAGAPMSNYFGLNAQAYAQRVSQDHDGRSVEEESGVTGSLLEHYRALSALRRAHPGLRHGDYYSLSASDTSVWAYLKVAPEETLLVAIHLQDGDLVASLDGSIMVPSNGASAVVDVETGLPLDSLTLANHAAYPVALGPYGHRVLRISAAPRDLRRLYADANRVVTQDSPTPADQLFELDQMFLRFDPAGLALGITGNVIDGGYGLALFFDTAPGGQNTLQTAGLPQPPSGLPQMAGLTFDAGFAPDQVLFVNIYGGQVYADWYSLASGGGGSKRYTGTVPVGARTPLTGGDNPNGMRVSYSPYNRNGVNTLSAVGAPTATDGFEILVPWADLGFSGPGQGLSLMAMLVIPDGFLANQFLPGLGTTEYFLGYPPFDLGTIAGQQYLVLGSTTGVLASLVSTSVGPAGVELVWSVSDRSLTELSVERSAGGAAWSPVGNPTIDGRGRVRFLDSAVSPHTRYGYRLIDRRRALTLDETWVEVPGASLALLSVASEPATGTIRVRFTSSGRAPVRLEAFDIGGRRVAARDLGKLEPGEHSVRANDRALSPGVYFVRLREGEAQVRGRAALVR